MNRRALLLGIVGAVLLLVLWYMFLWSPTNDDITAAQDRQVEADQQATRLEAEIRRLRAAQQNEAAQRARLELLRATIPDDPNLAQFILDTNDAAVRSGIDFISVAPAVPTAAAAPAATTATTVAGGAPTPGAAPAEIRVALQIQGGYFQLLDFVNRLDQMPRLVVTDGLNVSGAQGAGGRLTVALTARMFTRTIPQGFAGAPATTTSTTAPGATTTTVVGGATTTTAPGTATTTTTAGAAP